MNDILVPGFCSSEICRFGSLDDGKFRWLDQWMEKVFLFCGDIFCRYGSTDTPFQFLTVVNMPLSELMKAWDFKREYYVIFHNAKI